MSEITILHLSDIHFKKDKDDDRTTFRTKVRKAMVAQIKEHLENTNLVLDFVAVTGDIAFSGKEYDEAKQFFDDLKSVVPETTIFLPVPGNHDVNRDNVMTDFSLHENIIRKNNIDEFLENDARIKSFVTCKFKAYRRFSNSLNPTLELYENEDDYFWVKNFEDKNISFLGLNSCWASENDNDRFNITLGLPQVRNALDKATCSNKILLMHHPFDWFHEADFNESHGDLFKNCGLILHGHIHKDKASVSRDPSNSYITLTANASYTENLGTGKAKKGFIGFQFIAVEFRAEGLTVNVCPYILDTRERIQFFPDTRRWEGQNGKPCFDLDTFRSPTMPTRVDVSLPPIPQIYKDWVRQFHSTISFDQLAKKGEALPVQLLDVYIPLETANPFRKAELERIGKMRGEKNRLEMKDELEGEEADLKEPATIDIEALMGRVDCMLLRGQAVWVRPR